MKAINVEKLRRQYLSRLRLSVVQDGGLPLNYKEKLISREENTTENRDAFEVAFARHLENLANGRYDKKSNSQVFNEFVYLFDRQIRKLLCTGSEQVRRWTQSYLVDYFSDCCHSFKIRYILWDEEDRKSCFTDAFLDFLDKAGDKRYEFYERIALKSFFFSIYHKKCVDLKRKKTANKNRSNQFWTDEDDKLLKRLSVPARALVEASAFEFAAAHLRAAVSELGGNCAKIISRFHLQGWSLEEISEEMGMTLNSVKTTKSRCLDKLREIMNKKMKAHE